MSWVILEGPDGTGKTTLAEKLRKQGYLYQHAGPEDTLPVLAKRMAELQGLKYVVWDRAHLGEAVYGPLDRNSTPDRGWWNLLEAFLLEKNAICYLLTEQHEDKPDYLGKSGNARYREVEFAYQRVVLTSHLTWLAPHSIRALVERTVDNVEATDPWEWRPDAEGLGGIVQDVTSVTIYPELWVLGEQQNPLADVPWPFATRCGIELVWPVVDPRTVRVSNALRAGRTMDPIELHHRWEDMGHPKVVALGKTAQTACHVADVPIHDSLTHPQYHLRFHAHKGDLYRDTLKHIITAGSYA